MMKVEREALAKVLVEMEFAELERKKVRGDGGGRYTWSCLPLLALACREVPPAQVETSWAAAKHLPASRGVSGPEKEWISMRCKLPSPNPNQESDESLSGTIARRGS